MSRQADRKGRGVRNRTSQGARARRGDAVRSLNDGLDRTDTTELQIELEREY